MRTPAKLLGVLIALLMTTGALAPGAGGGAPSADQESSHAVPSTTARPSGLTRISAGPPTVIDVPSFGETGPYLKITGTYEGELDLSDPRNAVIADIDLAPQMDGKVRYRSTFFIMRPLDLSRGNGKIFYDFGNRGNNRGIQWLNDGAASNDPSTAEHFGNGFLMRQGYIVALNGWAGDVAPGNNRLTIDLPTARNPDGTSVTGMVATELIPQATSQTTVSLPYDSNDISPSNGVLTVRQHQEDPRVPVDGWTWVNERQISFPEPANLRWIYEFVYEARDPLIMGIGHAATRDFLSFLRWETHDDFGNPNPVAMPGGIEAVYSWGRSQGGRVQRDFLRWGFNEDLNGRRVIDGMIPYGVGAGGHMWMNYRFSQPTVSSQHHSRHHAREPEFPHTFPVMTDPLTGQTDGILRRCQASGTCPKVINLDGANEYWMKTSSLNHTDAFGNDLDIDALAPDVRVYLIASTEHNTPFNQRPELIARCQQMPNPLYNSPVFRAMTVAIDRWVTEGVAPTPSRVPKRSDGTLVLPEDVDFPTIPATSYAGWAALPEVEFHPGSMNHNAPMDFSVVPFEHAGDLRYTVQVSQVDGDGNEVAGIRLPYLAAPLGTHTGWNWYPPGLGSPNRCGQDGSFIPFANTRAERLAAGDPRPSLEERYPTHGAYVSAVARAATRLQREGFLLEEDVDRMVSRAARHGVRLWMQEP